MGKSSERQRRYYPSNPIQATHPLRMTHPMVWTHASSDLCFTAHTSIIIFLWGINLIGALWLNCSDWEMETSKKNRQIGIGFKLDIDGVNWGSVVSDSLRL